MIFLKPYIEVELPEPTKCFKSFEENPMMVYDAAYVAKLRAIIWTLAVLLILTGGIVLKDYVMIPLRNAYTIEVVE